MIVDMKLGYADRQTNGPVPPPSHWSTVASVLSVLSGLAAIAGPLLCYFQNDGFHRLDHVLHVPFSAFAAIAFAALVCGLIGLGRNGNRQPQSILGIVLPIAAFFFGCLCVMVAAMSG
jgi:hypothetical protein